MKLVIMAFTTASIALSTCTVAQDMDHDMHAMDHNQHGTDHSSSGRNHHHTDIRPVDATNNAPPPVPKTFYANRLYSPDEMAAARNAMFDEHGNSMLYQVIVNLAEYQIRDGRDGYHWEGEGWFGNDLNRFVLKSRGEGGWREDVESAEVQTLYSRALDPYWDLQAGIRHDFEPGSPTTYATFGVEGLAPYWLDVEAALFLSEHGDLLARTEAHSDLRITQRLVLKPLAELDFSAQDIAASELGSGLTNVEAGLRLRYEVTREFAPYIGIVYERKIGDTADYARVHGEDTSSTSIVFGARVWF